MDIEPPIIGTTMRVIKFLLDMRKRDLLLLCCITAIVVSFGVLAGYIPSPLLIAMAQHAQILESQKDQKTTDAQILEVLQLILYESRETCMHGAKTDPEKSRCDRQSVRDAILGDILPREESTNTPK